MIKNNWNIDFEAFRIEVFLCDGIILRRKNVEAELMCNTGNLPDSPGILLQVGEGSLIVLRGRRARIPTALRLRLNR